MANLKEVKNRITSVQSTQQITKAMKMVAASKLRRAQERIEKLRPYAEKLNTILQNVSSGTEVDIAYATQREVNRVLVVVITSDRGLCGGFNNTVLKAATKLVEGKYANELEAGFVSIMPIGKRANEYFTKRNFHLVDDYTNMFQNLDFDTAKKAPEFAMESFINEKFDQVELVYNEFKNVATQLLRIEQFLPIVAEESNTSETKVTEAETEYLFEPSKEFIIEDLVPKSLKIKFYKAILESNAAEHGARMTAMGQATDNAGELLKELKLTYNRTRQAAITTEILEIVAGAQALKSGK